MLQSNLLYQLAKPSILWAVFTFFTSVFMIEVSLTASEVGGTGIEFQKSATWVWPEASQFATYLESYIEQQSAIHPDLREQVQIVWQSTEPQHRGPEFLDRLMRVGGVLDPRIEHLYGQLLDPGQRPPSPADLDWLSSDVPGWMQDTIRLAIGRSFTQHKLFDEGLEILAGIELVQTCDPSSLLFYRATCEHHLLKRDECLQNVKLLLERDSELPVRYSQLAHLMLADIEPLKEDSLDEVARLMRDVQRRLDLGRAGTRVRDEEQQILDKLDKMIDKIEQQLQQQQQQQQANSSPNNQSQGRPMDESRAAGDKGPGDVDQKDNGSRAGWGNLPPAERQEALQKLTEELPSHYRDVIEGYFRQLAKERR
ncbi:MAG: hypothetical protein KDB03_05500 [Planctomycetales bacterium]|nr:hypothetical protein [Planctomycetales bacterium]